MPMERDRYPANWNQLATEIKAAANWTCQECGRPCRKPGVDWHEFVSWLLTENREDWYIESCDEVHDEETGEWVMVERPQRFTLTVAHLDHTPENCDPANLKAMCAPCHNRYDAPNRAANRKAKRSQSLEKQGQLNLLEVQ